MWKWILYLPHHIHISIQINKGILISIKIHLCQKYKNVFWKHTLTLSKSYHWVTNQTFNTEMIIFIYSSTIKQKCMNMVKHSLLRIYMKQMCLQRYFKNDFTAKCCFNLLFRFKSATTPHWHLNRSLGGCS